MWFASAPNVQPPLLQHDGGRAGAPFAAAEQIVGRGRDQEYRADAPDDAGRAWSLGREEQALGDVAEAELFARGPAMSFCQIDGRIVREIMFQSSFSEIGTTGWMLSTARSPSLGRSLRRS